MFDRAFHEKQVRDLQDGGVEEGQVRKHEF